MNITNNNTEEPKCDFDSLSIKLSNGDSIWIYDDRNGYASIEVTRHDENRIGKDCTKSKVVTKTSRARNLKRRGSFLPDRFKNVLIKDKTINVRSGLWGNKWTSIGFSHFYSK